MSKVYLLISLVLFFTDVSKANPLQNLRHILDLSLRNVEMGENDPMQLAFIGLDLHRVISTTSEDRVTLTLQPYLAVVRNGPDGWNGPTQKHPIFDGSNDWAIQWRNFNANVKILQDGSLNVRLGHIEVPFGVEYLIDTNGRALDYAHGANFVGIKADWGLSVNGVKNGYEYEIALLRGSGNGYESESVTGETPYFATGRVGTNRNADWGIGVSALGGKLLTPSRALVERSRYALDAYYYLRNVTLLGEVSAGKGYGGPPDNSAEIIQFFSEINWRSPSESSQVWLQFVNRLIDPEGTRELRAGAAWMPFHKTTVSGQLTRIVVPSTSNNWLIQVRYRY